MADQGYNLKYTGKEIDDLLGKAKAMNSSAQVPTGGSTGQVLAKKSATDYDLKWVDQSAGGDTHGIPAGGISGQVLTKKSSTNFDAEWKTPSSAGVQSVNGESGAVVLTADDVGALAKSIYDPQNRRKDIFKTIEGTAAMYTAKLTLNGWTACTGYEPYSGFAYKQTAKLVPDNSGAPTVTANSTFTSGIQFVKTGVIATDKILGEVQDIINDEGLAVSGYGSVTVYVQEKPTAEINARWQITT